MGGSEGVGSFDTLQVSEDEGEGAGRSAAEGGPGQPSAPNVPPAAMKSILPEVRRQEEGKGRRGQPEAGAAGSGDSSASAAETGRTGKGGKRAGEDVGGCAHKGTPGREGGTGTTVAPAPMLVQAVAARVAPTGQCGGKGGGGEGGAPPAGGAVRGAGAHGAPALSPPAPGAGTGHHLPAGDGPGEDGDEEGGRGGGAEQRSSAGQWCGTSRRRQGQAGERSEAKRTTGEGKGEGGTPQSRRQGTRGDEATRQRAGEGEWPWVRGLAGVPREGIGMVGRCSPASRPTNRPTIPAAAKPGDGDGVPAPAGVPGHAATGARAAAPAGQWDSVGGARGEGRRAQKGMGEVRGGREEPEGQGGQGQG